MILVFFSAAFLADFLCGAVRVRSEEREFLVGKVCQGWWAGVNVVLCNKVDVWNWCTSVTPSIDDAEKCGPTSV